MQNAGNHPSGYGLTNHGIRNWDLAFWNLSAAQLIEKALHRHEGVLANNGALVVKTGHFTGRSPSDKFVVNDSLTESTVNWGPVNQPMTEAKFNLVHSKLAAFWQGRELFVQDLMAGADSAYTMPVRVVTRKAWHNLFGRQLLIRRSNSSLEDHVPEFTLLFEPDFHTEPSDDGTHSTTCVALSFQRRMVIIAGTSYAGELKKSVFTILNYLLPERRVLPMHCSANLGPGGDVALFFGLSGTGKTTLSADPNRKLIGDDEHGWSESGVFNFEGGCYAKCIRLSREQEPQIWNAIRFGAVLENVAVDADTRDLDYNSDLLTENTRAAYPVEFIDNAVIPGVAGHPRSIVFLAADAFGVLPPISKLSPDQAMYHFLSGYTSKLAGTERGLGKEPQAAFSACFGEPFLPRPPRVYAEMLGEKLRRHGVSCWLVNTGWIGGPYGVGRRIPLEYTRAMVDAAISGLLDATPMQPHPVLRALVPAACPGVPVEALDARGQWSDKAAYDAAAGSLSARFRKNFEKFGPVAAEIREAGPIPV